MGRIISFVSGKGGVGKSVLCAGIGCALGEMGKSVCLLDFDFGLNNLDLMLNIEQNVVYDLSDFLSGRTRLRQTLVSEERRDNVYFLSTSKINTIAELDLELVSQTIKQLAAVFDFVLIDCPAGIDNANRFCIEEADEVCVVVCPNIASLRDANKIASLIFNLGKKPRLIINRLKKNLVLKKKSLNEEEISKMLNMQCLGVCYECEALGSYLSLNNVYDCSMEAKQNFNLLAANLIGNKYDNFCPQKHAAKGFLKFFSRLKGEGV